MMESIQNVIDVVKSKELIELVIAVGILVVFVLGSSWFSRIICKLFKVKKIKLKENAIYKNLKIIFVIYLSILFLQLPFYFMNIFTKISKIILIILITKLAADLADPKISLLKRFVKDEKKGQSSYKFITKIIRGLIYIIGVFIIISEFILFVTDNPREILAPKSVKLTLSGATEKR